MATNIAIGPKQAYGDIQLATTPPAGLHSWALRWRFEFEQKLGDDEGRFTLSGLRWQFDSGLTTATLQDEQTFHDQTWTDLDNATFTFQGTIFRNVSLGEIGLIQKGDDTEVVSSGFGIAYAAEYAALGTVITGTRWATINANRAVSPTTFDDVALYREGVFSEAQRGAPVTVEGPFGREEVGVRGRGTPGIPIAWNGSDTYLFTEFPAQNVPETIAIPAVGDPARTIDISTSVDTAVSWLTTQSLTFGSQRFSMPP